MFALGRSFDYLLTSRRYKELTALFGDEWATEYLIPSISDIRRNESYLRRLTAVQAFAMMATEMDPQTAKLELLPMVLDMATDNVSLICYFT